MASTLVYAEVCGHGDVRTARHAADIDAKVSAFFEQGFIEWVEVDLTVARDARRVSKEHGLRGADAIHLASAVRASCDVLMTWDKRFPIGKAVDKVEVQEPRLFGQLQIDDLPRAVSGPAHSENH